MLSKVYEQSNKMDKIAQPRPMQTQPQVQQGRRGASSWSLLG